MKTQVAHLRKIIRDLTQTLDREVSAFKTQQLDKIIPILRKKDALLTEFESWVTRISGAEEDASLIAEIESLRIKAHENAVILSNYRQGLQDARERLEAILSADRKTGLYARDGEHLSAPGSSSFTRDA